MLNTVIIYVFHAKEFEFVYCKSINFSWMPAYQETNYL
jgi:hypothetical protein